MTTQEKTLKKVNIVKINLLPKQLEFMQSKSKELAYIGGYGAGKSRVLCYKALQHALIPHNLVLLTRRTLSALKDSTLRTLLLPDGELPAVLQQGSYEYNISRNMINIFGGGSILTVGCEDEMRVRSINAGFICVDEACELEEDEYMSLKGRLRSTTDTIRGIALATNPASTHHWIYKRFYENKDEDKHLITARTTDNIFLPKDYVRDLEKLTGTAYKRYVLGEFCNNEGAVYKEFNSDLHIKEIDINDNQNGESYNLICADIGFNDNTAILVLNINVHLNRVYVVGETYTNTLTPSDIGSKLVDLKNRYNARKIIIDPSAKGTILELEKMGLTIIKANNAIDEGIARVKEYISKNKLIVSKKCSNLLRELDLYSYKDGSDKPEDKNNHACDALRYGIAELFDGRLSFITPTVYIDGKEVLPDCDDIFDEDEEETNFRSI